MTEEQLKCSDNVVQYIRPRHVLDTDPKDPVDSAAFLWNGKGLGLSINWLEYSKCSTKEHRLGELRSLIHLEMSRNGLLAELNVGTVMSRLANLLGNIKFVRTPSPATKKFPFVDESHCELTGVPHQHASDAIIVSRAIARCVVDTHRARLD